MRFSRIISNIKGNICSIIRSLEFISIIEPYERQMDGSNKKSILVRIGDRCRLFSRYRVSSSSERWKLHGGRAQAVRQLTESKRIVIGEMKIGGRNNRATVANCRLHQLTHRLPLTIVSSGLLNVDANIDDVNVEYAFRGLLPRWRSL